MRNRIVQLQYIFGFDTHNLDNCVRFVRILDEIEFINSLATSI